MVILPAKNILVCYCHTAPQVGNAVTGGTNCPFLQTPQEQKLGTSLNTEGNLNASTCSPWLLSLKYARTHLPSEELTAELCCRFNPHWDTRKDRRPWHCDSTQLHTGLGAHLSPGSVMLCQLHFCSAAQQQRAPWLWERALIQWNACQCQLPVLELMLSQCCLRF